MQKNKRERLEEVGWEIADIKEFLVLFAAEIADIERRIKEVYDQPHTS